MYGTAVGVMGLAPEAFDRMTFAEFIYAQQGYAQRTQSDYQVQMNIARWESYAIMSASADLKGASATELLPLPWDARTGVSSTGRTKLGKLTKRELERRRAEALDDIKILEKK